MLIMKCAGGAQWCLWNFCYRILQCQAQISMGRREANVETRNQLCISLFSIMSGSISFWMWIRCRWQSSNEMSGWRILLNGVFGFWLKTRQNTDFPLPCFIKFLWKLLSLNPIFHIKFKKFPLSWKFPRFPSQ